MLCSLALKSIRIAADRERAAEVTREEEAAREAEYAAREAEVAVKSTAEKQAADITTSSSGGLGGGGLAEGGGGAGDGGGVVARGSDTGKGITGQREGRELYKR